MVSEAELYTIRAEDEFLLAEKDMLLSTDAKESIENARKFVANVKALI